MASNFDALRLAGLLEHEANEHGKTDYKHRAAAELRRQHSRLEADEALMRTLLDALESCDPGDFSTGHVIHASYNEALVESAITALRKRLESSK